MKTQFETHLSSRDKCEIYNTVDQIGVMRGMEDRYQGCDYSQDIALSSESDGVRVDDACRRKMIEWCFQVVQFYDIEREIVVVGFSYVDRYIGELTDRSILNDRKKYQLLVMTSIYLGTKVFGTKVIDINLLVNLGRETYLKEEFEEMERDILETLQWRVHPPTSMSFVRHLLMVASMLKMDADLVLELQKLSYFQIEKSLYEYKNSLINPSVVAICSIVNSLEHELFDTLAHEVKTSFILELMRICNIDQESDDVQYGRCLLSNDSSPIFKINYQKHGTGIENSRTHQSHDCVRLSPVCVSR